MMDCSPRQGAGGLSDVASDAASNTPEDATDGLPLAALVGSRLCHDLVSPLGAIGNGVELLEMSGEFPGIARSPEFTLIAESVRAARARIRLFRTAFGQSADGQRMAVAELKSIIQDSHRGSRLSVELDATGEMPRAEARMILLAVLCMESGLPWGGRLLVCRGERGWRLVGEASRTRIDPPLWARLNGEATLGGDLAPADVHFAVLAALSAEQRRPLTWEADDTGAEISF